MPSSSSSRRPAPTPPRNWGRLTLFVVGASALGVLAWMIGQRTGLQGSTSGSAAVSPSASLSANRFGPAVVSAKRIAGLPKELGHAVFWAGQASAVQSYELTIAADGSVAIRYLVASSSTDHAHALVVATYPRKNAFGVLTDESAGTGTTTATPAPNSLALRQSADKHAAFLAVSGVDYLAQVYDSNAEQAWKRVSSGGVSLIP